MDALDWVRDHAIELVTGRDPAQERAAATAGAAGDSARSDVYGQQAQLRADLPYGTDPTSITTVDSWASWSHPQIKAMVDRLGSGALHDTALGWDTLGKAIESKFGDFKAEMAQIVTTGWEGRAADAATASTASYAQWAASLGTAARYMGTKVTEAATGAEQTRAMVPDPVSFSVSEGLLTSIANPLLGAADIYKQKTAQTEAHAAAVRVMTSVYTPVYQQSDAGIPTLDSSTSSSTQPGAPAPTPSGPGVSPSNQSSPEIPPATGNPPSGATHSSWTGPTPSSPSGTTPSSAANPGPSGLAAAPLQGPAWPSSTAAGPPGGQWQPVDPAPLQSTTGPAAQVGSAGWTPPASAVGSVGGSSGYGFGESGGPGAGGFGGSGSGSTGSGAYGGGAYGGGAYGGGAYGGGAYGGGAYGGGAGGSGAGGFGRGLGGPLGAGAAVGAGAGAGGGTGAGVGSTMAGGAAAGARGAAGGGMGAGGRGARGEEDFEHNTPSYLISEENGSELVGELPRVAPAVIGE